jgi:glycosyltransferase involved in cell wall biosynthesis
LSPDLRDRLMDTDLQLDVTRRDDCCSHEGPICILELRSVRGTGGGPEKTILLGAARSNPTRFPITVCYIRDARDEIFDIHTRAMTAGVDYAEVLERHSFDRRIWRQLVELIRSRQIDIVHSHDYKTDLLALLLARAEGVKPLATAHGWIRNTPRERFYCWADVYLLKRFPRVIAVSGPIKKTLVQHGARADRVHQIPNGVDHELYRRRPATRAVVRRELGISADTVVVGSVGRLSAEKRFDLLLEAAAKLTAPPHIVIVGEGSQRAHLSAQARALGLGDRLLLLGQRTDVSELLQAFDVYVQSSDTEGLPNVVLEAMATEVPVVATRVGGTTELIDDDVHGLLVPAGDATRIAEAVNEILRDRRSAERRTAAARLRIEQELSFSVRMARVEEIYRTLFASPPLRTPRHERARAY